MEPISVCFVFRIDSEGTLNDREEENQYQNHLKPILTFLYSHQDCFFTVAVSGRKAEWLESEVDE